jgi:3-hydroxyisobutyrate dehydrogenase-like beta-hydroxyacid dehydrogenase
MADPRQIIYCGPAGQGQVGKVVQQLKQRLVDAASMEVIAFGVRAGLGLDVVGDILMARADGADNYSKLLRTIETGRHEGLGCMFGEWTYYLEEAKAQGIPMPMLESLHAFCQTGVMSSRDEQGRPQPSVWHELLYRTGPALDRDA